MEDIKGMSCALNREIALFADLPGPKIRIGRLDSPIEVKNGEIVRFSSIAKKGNIQVMYEPLEREVRKGMLIDIGDGNARFKVQGIEGREVVCRALNNGIISSRKGVSFVGASLKLSSPTRKDLELAEFAKKNDFDFLGVSYVKTAKGVSAVKKIAKEMNVIAKIGTKEAVKNLDEIADAADGIMVARGDLSMGIHLENLPEIQSKIISTTRLHGKPVIVSTQLLTSMIVNPTPTRAEANDIANAVLQGTDCLMLSDETIVGKYPVAAVRFLAKSAAAAERFSMQKASLTRLRITSVNKAIAFAAANLADEYKTDCIFVPTQTGATAKIVSALRPRTSIIALAANERVRRSLGLYYGIRAYGMKHYDTMDDMLESVRRIAKEKNIRNYIVVSGSPNWPGTTDTLKYIQNGKEKK
jgi:pyruvate kinase